MPGGLIPLLALLVSSHLQAQQLPISDPLDSGTVVRLTWNDGSRAVGRLLRPLQAGGDSVIYCRYPGPACIGDHQQDRVMRPLPELRRVEVQRGSRSAQGALIGGLVGVAVIGLGRWAFSDADSPAPWTEARVAVP